MTVFIYSVAGRRKVSAVVTAWLNESSPQAQVPLFLPLAFIVIWLGLVSRRGAMTATCSLATCYRTWLSGAFGTGLMVWPFVEPTFRL